jgi:hypothetical protein
MLCVAVFLCQELPHSSPAQATLQFDGFHSPPSGPGVIFKGLVAVCNSVCIFFNSSFIHHKHSLRPISIYSQLSAQWSEPPRGAEPRFELGPAVQQQASAPLTEPRCTLERATLHPRSHGDIRYLSGINFDLRYQINFIRVNTRGEAGLTSLAC